MGWYDRSAAQCCTFRAQGVQIPLAHIQRVVQEVFPRVENKSQGTTSLSTFCSKVR
jgi:hypothetical protein